MADIPEPAAPPAGARPDIRALLERTTTVAVVGFSTDPSKTAHRIPALVMQAGFRVIPVHPTATEILGAKAYRSLADIPEPLDMVDVFRPRGEATAVVMDAIAAGARSVWLQSGIVSPEGRAAADRAGIDYVEDECLGVEVRRFGIRKPAR